MVLRGRDRLSPRALNRSLLARQGLLARSAVGVEAMVEQLVGLQAQIPGNPYVGLWSRLRDFAPAALSDLIAEGGAVRAQLMRTTIHLVTAADHDVLAPVMAGVHARHFRGTWLKRMHGTPVEPVVDAGRGLLAEAPRTRAELAATLAPASPEAEPEALAQAVTLHTPVVQVPPRGLWGASGQARLGLRPPAGGAAVDAIVLRYLAAFGPATVADIRTWSGLTGLREVVDRLDLVRYDGGLLDVADAPFPKPDTPAPVRFLPEYDNALLSHADRSRIVARQAPMPRGGTRGTVLVDGFVAAAWSYADGEVSILGDVPREALAEADALAAFLSSGG
ncbi:MAG: hypothetical protein QOI80_3417 [Solirubrobacteraceae bacterium]|nr:hypothetical protein [Solirubrobacteraceae bacterium]